MGEGDGDGGEVVGGYELDFEPDGLGFLFGFDEDVCACWTAFGPFGVQRDPEGFEFAAIRYQY